MPYPDTYENCTELAQVTQINDVVDYNKIQSIIKDGTRFINKHVVVTRSLWKQNTSNTIAIDLAPYDIYNETRFTLHYKKHGDTTTTKVNVAWNEIHNPVPVSNNFITSTLVSTGASTITIDSSTGALPVEVGQVYWDGQSNGVFIYVSDISVVPGTNDEIITLRRPVETEISNGTVFTLVGNTGIYETNLTLTELGEYTIIITNPSIGLHSEAINIEVKEELGAYGLTPEEHDQLMQLVNYDDKQLKNLAYAILGS